MIKSLGREWSSDQGRFSPIKILDPSCKHFYGWLLLGLINVWGASFHSFECHPSVLLVWGIINTPRLPALTKYFWTKWTCTHSEMGRNPMGRNHTVAHQGACPSASATYGRLIPVYLASYQAFFWVRGYGVPCSTHSVVLHLLFIFEYYARTKHLALFPGLHAQHVMLGTSILCSSLTLTPQCPAFT